MLEDEEWDQLQREINDLLGDSVDKLYAEIADDEEEIATEEDVLDEYQKIVYK